MPAYFVLYGVLRFIVEEYRGDHNPVRVGDFTDQQVFSLVTAGVGVILFLFLWMRSRRSGAALPKPAATLERR